MAIVKKTLASLAVGDRYAVIVQNPKSGHYAGQTVVHGAPEMRFATPGAFATVEDITGRVITISCNGEWYEDGGSPNSKVCVLVD